MYINKFLAKKIGIGLAVIAIPAVAVGGYFAVSNSDKYRSYYATPTNDSPRGYIDAYKKAVYNGAEVIAAPGFTHKDPILNAFSGSDNFFDKTGFMLFDETTIPFGGPLNKKATLNTWSVTFRSDLGSIQTGIALGMFLNENKDVFADDGKLTFGLFGGLPFASVTSFMGGIQMGVQWFNENVATSGSGYLPVNEVSLRSSNPTEKELETNSYFSGSFSPSGGSEIIETYINKKTDVIIPVAGPQVWLAQKLIIKHQAKSVVLGVDSAVEDDPQAQELPFKNNGKVIGNGKYVQFSSMKNLAVAADTALKIINNGNVAPDKTDPKYDNFVDSTTGIGGFGTIAVGNIENGCAGVSPAGQKYLQEALHESHKQDPSKDAKYNTQEFMAWKSPDFNPAWINSEFKPVEKSKETLVSSNYNNYFVGLKQSFENVVGNPKYGFTENEKPLNKQGFIVKGKESDADKVKVILSGSTSILLDGSFSQSCYKGLVEYYASMNIKLPYPSAIATASYSVSERKRD